MANEIDKKILQELENNFDGVIWKRGVGYYREGLVSNIIFDEIQVKAKCLGNSDYKLSINIDTREMSCSCPYMGYCKHLAALILWLKQNKPISINELQEKLLKKSKEELVEIVLKVQSEFPDIANIHIENDFSNEAMTKLIKDLWIRSHHEYDLLDTKREIIEKELLKNKNFDLFSLYLRKLIDLRDHFDIEHFEDLIQDFLYKYDEVFPFLRDEIELLEKKFSGYEYFFDDFKYSLKSEEILLQVFKTKIPSRNNDSLEIFRSFLNQKLDFPFYIICHKETRKGLNYEDFELKVERIDDFIDDKYGIFFKGKESKKKCVFPIADEWDYLKGNERNKQYLEIYLEWFWN
ncbi:MAG: SWIM zinc finger family protein [Candidatus Woesearchaeota archaeon]|nr:SWIM zinc finger family protein [Candidatus Woesearchaeota archaeon]